MTLFFACSCNIFLGLLFIWLHRQTWPWLWVSRNARVLLELHYTKCRRTVRYLDIFTNLVSCNEQQIKYHWRKRISLPNTMGISIIVINSTLFVVLGLTSFFYPSLHNKRKPNKEKMKKRTEKREKTGILCLCLNFVIVCFSLTFLNRSQLVSVELPIGTLWVWTETYVK